MSDPEILSAEFSMEYDYRRSLGEVLSRFLTGLRDRRIEGVRTAKGRVLVPPKEYDPETGDSVGEFVEVGQSGTVKSWAWVYSPREQHPLDHPFAWALVQLDGADTCLLHAVDAGDPERMSTGMRVAVKWAEQTQGGIGDIACFVPEGAQ